MVEKIIHLGLKRIRLENKRKLAKRILLELKSCYKKSPIRLKKIPIREKKNPIRTKKNPISKKNPIRIKKNPIRV